MNQFRYFLLFPFILVAVAGAAEPQVLSRAQALADWLSNKGSLWQNGLFVPVQLSQNATPLELAKKVFEVTSNSVDPKIEVREVLKDENVVIDRESFKALTVNSSKGLKIILLKYEAGGWWHRTFDIEDTKPNQASVPTATSVTPAADAPVAPDAAAAHL